MKKLTKNELKTEVLMEQLLDLEERADKVHSQLEDLSPPKIRGAYTGGTLNPLHTIGLGKLTFEVNIDGNIQISKNEVPYEVLDLGEASFLHCWLRDYFFTIDPARKLNS